MSSPFEHKSVYHSALVKESPLEVTITCSEPMESKFSKPGAEKPPYISFKCDGEEHTYNCENEACGEALTGLKGQTVTITASGRGKDADIMVEGGNNRGRETRGNQSPTRQERAPQREERQPERQQAAPEDREAKELKTFKQCKAYGARCSVLMDMALRFAEPLAKEHLATDADGTFDTEDLRALAGTLFIEMARHININDLPTKWIDTKPPQPRQESPWREEPPPRQEPDDDAALDDIPF